MSDYDDAMNDYDWYQNTGENREYFEDNQPGQRSYHQPNYQQSGDDGGCIGVGLLCIVVIVIIGLLVWLI